MRGVDGEVGILAGHVPMLVRLAIGPLRILQTEGPEVAVVIDGGFAHVGTDEEGTRIDVMATEAELRSEIDVDAARRRVEELQDRDTAETEAEVEHQKAELQKALARVSLAG
jgi:F-type H+-transporting ATPase subunit epsilon